MAFADNPEPSPLFIVNAIREPLDDLCRGLRENHAPNRVTYNTSYARLTDALANSRSMLSPPQPGYGLVAIYWRFVVLRCKVVEQHLETFNGNLAKLMFEREMPLETFQRCQETALHFSSLSGPNGPSVANLLDEAETSRLRKLRELGEAWKQEFVNEPSWPAGLMKIELLNQKQHWDKSRSKLVDKAERLVFDAIEQCEISAEHFRNDEFVEAIAGQLQSSHLAHSGLLQALGFEFSGDGVIALAEWLEGESVNQAGSLTGDGAKDSPASLGDMPTSRLLREWFGHYGEFCRHFHKDEVTPEWLADRQLKLNHFRDLCGELGRRGEALQIDAANLFRFQGSIQSLDDIGRVVGMTAELMDSIHALAKRIEARSEIKDDQSTSSQTSENPYRAAYEASHFTNKFRVQPYEWDKVIADCETALSLGFDSGEVGGHIANQLRVRRRDKDMRERIEANLIGKALAAYGATHDSPEDNSATKQPSPAGDPHEGGVDGKETTEPQGSTTNGEATNAEPSYERILASLTPAVQLAWQGYQLVEPNLPANATDDQAYKQLSEQEHALADNLPVADTWKRYVREARKALGLQKNQPRAGRELGGSVVRAKDI